MEVREDPTAARVPGAVDREGSPVGGLRTQRRPACATPVQNPAVAPRVYEPAPDTRHGGGGRGDHHPCARVHGLEPPSLRLANRAEGFAPSSFPASNT